MAILEGSTEMVFHMVWLTLWLPLKRKGIKEIQHSVNTHYVLGALQVSSPSISSSFTSDSEDQDKHERNQTLKDGWCRGMGEESWLAEEGVCAQVSLSFSSASPLSLLSSIIALFMLQPCQLFTGLFPFISLPKFLKGRGHASTLYPSVPIDTWCKVVLKCLLMEALRDNYAKNSKGNSKDSSHSGGQGLCSPHLGANALSTTQEQRIQKDWVKEEGGHYPRMITMTSPGQALFHFLCSFWSADPDVVPDYTDPLRKIHSVLTNSHHLLSISLGINTSFTDGEVISLSKVRSWNSVCLLLLKFIPFYL